MSDNAIIYDSLCNMCHHTNIRTSVLNEDKSWSSIIIIYLSVHALFTEYVLQTIRMDSYNMWF